MTTRRSFLALAATTPVLMLARPALADEAPVYAEGGIAIDGTDPVAYFSESAPLAGDPGLTTDWNGATWRFTSAANRETFLANPEAYAPQFGGYCAWAVAEGYIAPTVPGAWTIHDGKLYLNFSRRIRRRWERDIPGNIARGVGNWPAVLQG